MISMLGHALLGLLVGLIASKLMNSSHGLIVNTLLGLAGGWLGGRIGRWLGLYEEGHFMGFVMSVVGAMIIVAIAHFI